MENKENEILEVLVDLINSLEKRGILEKEKSENMKAVLNNETLMDKPILNEDIPLLVLKDNLFYGEINLATSLIYVDSNDSRLKDTENYYVLNKGEDYKGDFVEIIAGGSGEKEGMLNYAYLRINGNTIFMYSDSAGTPVERERFAKEVCSTLQTIKEPYHLKHDFDGIYYVEKSISSYESMKLAGAMIVAVAGVILLHYTINNTLPL